MKIPDFPDKEWIRREFEKRCKELGIDAKAVEELSIYELTDGTRTSTDLEGPDAYADGGLFILRLYHMLGVLGCKSAYALTAGEKHQVRADFADIMEALKRQVPVWEDYVRQYGMLRLNFYGNWKTLKSSQEFIKELRRLETLSRKGSMNAIILINYHSDAAFKDRVFKKMPQANVIIKHTKGQVNEGLWLPGKLVENSFVYVQNASMSSIWNDEELLWLVVLATRSMVLHKGRQHGKGYDEVERKEIRQKRETEMSFTHKRFGGFFSQPRKRVVMFSHVGPEVYEF